MTDPELILNSLSSSGIIRISVLIVTHNRAQLLNKCLSALSSQTISPSEFEVLIGDNDSYDDSDEMWRFQMITLQIYYSRAVESNICAVQNKVRGTFVTALNRRWNRTKLFCRYSALSLPLFIMFIECY